MTNINEYLTVEDFPAMELEQAVFDDTALIAVMQLRANPCAFVIMEPDDGTRYEFTIVRKPLGSIGTPYVVANSYGPLYGWNGTPTIHPRYAQEHLVCNHNMWTATVVARFLCTLAVLLQEDS